MKKLFLVLLVATFFGCENSEKVAYHDELAAAIDTVDLWSVHVNSFSDSLKSGIDFVDIQHMKEYLQSSYQQLSTDPQNHESEYYLGLSDSLEKHVSQFRDSVILAPFNHQQDGWRILQESAAKNATNLQIMCMQGFKVNNCEEKIAQLYVIGVIASTAVGIVEVGIQSFIDNKIALAQLEEISLNAELRVNAEKEKLGNME